MVSDFLSMKMSIIIKVINDVIITRNELLAHLLQY